MPKKQFAKLFTLFIAVFFWATALFAQADKQTAGMQLTKAAIRTLLTDAVKKEFNMSFPVWKAYKYNDNSTEFYIILTESFDGVGEQNDTLHTKIKAFNLFKTPIGLARQWEINDFVIKPSKDTDTETSIWFWTKYAELKDLDGDGLIDPVIVYGTAGMNGTDDGRIKILLFYKGQKIAIRHQNGVLDNERYTQVDAAFYTLPPVIQTNIEKLMQKITADGFGIFPAG